MALIVRGVVKDYDWGIVDGLVPWTGHSTQGPQAELWFGVHPGGPSPLLGDDGVDTGEHLGDRFDIEAIPLLVKILAAARPLSVQVHPRRAVAEAGYATQQQSTGPRIYSDPFEKTELLVALTAFEAFAGWRDPDVSSAMLAAIPGGEQAADLVRMGMLDDAIRCLLALSSPDRIAALPAAAEAAGLPNRSVAAYRTVARTYPEDAGALITPMLDVIRLEVGEAIYLPAGVPHSYISGTGLEVMTSSDNVVRLGLTTKPVFVDEAIAALVPDLRPQVLRTRHNEIIWPVNAPFVVRNLHSGSERIPAGAYRIALLIEGSARVDTDGAELILRPGTAAVLAAQDNDAFVHADGLVAIVQSTVR